MIAPDRIYAQYRDKSKAVAWLNITRDVAESLRTTFDDIRQTYDIDSQSGAQLDVIGRIVVLDRGFESLVIFPAIQWGAPSSQFRGVGIQFRSIEGAGTIGVSDAIYKVLLKAKIAKNNNEATLDGIISALNFIVKTPNNRVIDNEDMTFSVVFGAPLDAITRFAINTFDVLPRPQGVRFLGYIEEGITTQWGGIIEWGDERAVFNEV